MQCNAQIESSKLFRSIRIGKGMRYALGCLVFLSSSVFVFSQQISVIAQVSSRQVYVGEAFILQITVSGSDQVNLDNFAQIGEFKSSLSSSGPSNSRSITIINGKRTENIRKAYVIIYSLTAFDPGIKVIPSLEIEVAGSKYFSDQIPVDVLNLTNNLHLKLMGYFLNLYN